MVDRARNAPVLLPRVPRPTRTPVLDGAAPGLLRRGAVPETKAWRGSPGANRRCAGWFCLFRTQRLDDERRLVPLRAPRAGCARARRGIAGAAGCLAGARAHGLAVLVELAGRDARRLGRASSGSARRAGRLTASCLRRRASGVCGSEARRLAGRLGSRAASAAGLMLPGSWRNRISVLPRWCTGRRTACRRFPTAWLARLAIVTAGADLDQAMEVSARSIS